MLQKVHVFSAENLEDKKISNIIFLPKILNNLLASGLKTKVLKLANSSWITVFFHFHPKTEMLK
jgi:hypothetical protein